MITVNRDINMILRYSDIKIKANRPLAYSVLNPETNSLSPSAKSKGARFVSANIVANQVKVRIGEIRNKFKGLIERIFCKLILDMNKSIAIKIKAILTSYEIVWATLRRAPSSEYLEFEVHPAPKVVYTLSLEMAKKKIILKEKNLVADGDGVIVHNMRARLRFNRGAA